MIRHFDTMHTYCLYRSYMYRRMNMPKQAYTLRRLAARADEGGL